MIWLPTTPDEIRAWRDQLTRSGHAHKALLLSAALERIEALGAKSDAEMEHVKACEHIAEGDEGWEELRNICPSTAAVSRLRDGYTAGLELSAELGARSIDYRIRAESAVASLANALRAGEGMVARCEGKNSVGILRMCMCCATIPHANGTREHDPSCPVALWRAMPRAE